MALHRHDVKRYVAREDGGDSGTDTRIQNILAGRHEVKQPTDSSEVLASDLDLLLTL